MKKTNLIAAVIWIYIIGTGLLQGYKLPTMEIATHFPFPWQILVLMPLVIVVGAFFNKDIPGEFTIGKRVDDKFGSGTYREFLRVLRLELLFSFMSFGIGIVGLIRSNMLAGPIGAYSVSFFFISAGVSFLLAYFIGKKRYVFVSGHNTVQPVIPFTPTDGAIFWNEARIRRNIFFAVWAGWLIAGPCLIWIYSIIFSAFDISVRMFAALATWGAIWIWTAIRIKQLRCFKCGKQAFTTPYFFMSHAKCRNCGVTPQDQNT